MKTIIKKHTHTHTYVKVKLYDNFKARKINILKQIFDHVNIK